LSNYCHNHMTVRCMLVTRWEKVRRLGQPDRTLGQHVLLRGPVAMTSYQTIYSQQYIRW